MFPFRKKQLLDVESQQAVVAAIKEAESSTSGEIRVFVEAHCTFVNAVERAREIFLKLGMQKTTAKNAVLVYVALKDRQFALYGDEEIFNKAGGSAFWHQAADELKGHFKKEQITAGLCHCIHTLGQELATHFPHDPSIKKNELPDEIVFGK